MRNVPFPQVSFPPTNIIISFLEIKYLKIKIKIASSLVPEIIDPVEPVLDEGVTQIFDQAK